MVEIQEDKEVLEILRVPQEAVVVVAVAVLA